MDRIKFPYFNMQQLNLDWILDKLSVVPTILAVPALAGDDVPDVADMIDMKIDEIVNGISYMLAGGPDDPMDRRCMCLIYKIDKDNMCVFMMSMSGNIGAQFIMKTAGVWS